jgi:hypothetical protein
MLCPGSLVAVEHLVEGGLAFRSQGPSGFRWAARWKWITAVLVAGVSTPVIGPD